MIIYDFQLIKFLKNFQNLFHRWKTELRSDFFFLILHQPYSRVRKPLRVMEKNPYLLNMGFIWNSQVKVLRIKWRKKERKNEASNNQDLYSHTLTGWTRKKRLSYSHYSEISVFNGLWTDWWINTIFCSILRIYHFI